MIEYFDSHLYAFWFTVGFSLLALELLVLGFSTGFVLFLGLAALLSGALLWFQWIPASWLASIAAFAIGSVVISIGLWKPFKRLDTRSKKSEKDNSSDLIGLTFRIATDVDLANPGTTHYSGIDWRVEIDSRYEATRITAGTVVSVVSVDAGVFRVVPATRD